MQPETLQEFLTEYQIIPQEIVPLLYLDSCGLIIRNHNGLKKIIQFIPITKI